VKAKIARKQAAAGLAELVANTEDDYVSHAIILARDLPCAWLAWQAMLSK
jgi:hypothetical protein